MDLILRKALQETEKLLDWGPAENWTTQDFSDLSDKIQEKTGVSLSVTTLKRLWGKVNYKSIPATTTLNALVRFIGYENWQTYLQQHTTGVSEKQQEFDAKEAGEFPLVSKTFIYSTGLVMALAVLLFISFLLKKEEPPKVKAGKPFGFSIKMMEPKGVPNSVIFHYDATPAAQEDSIIIQQSWDKRLREAVPRDKNVHTSVYYYPGFFQAKLLVNGEIVKEQELYIRTNGWLPITELKNRPVYFEEEDALATDGVLHLPLTKIKEKNIPLQPETPWVSYFNTREFGGIGTDDFVFRTEVRNDYREGAAACRHTEIHLLFKGGSFVIPLSVKGCVSELALYDVQGKKEDPSGLGCDLSGWVKAELRVKNKKGQLFINDNLVYDDLDYSLPPSAITGLRFRFQGTGSVKAVSFSRVNGELIYEENFATQ